MTDKEELKTRKTIHQYPAIIAEDGTCQTPPMSEIDMRASLGIDNYSVDMYGPQAVMSGVLPDNACKFNPANAFKSEISPSNVDVSSAAHAARLAIDSIKHDDNGTV